MIIEVQWRDIPYEEALRCIHPEYSETQELIGREAWEQRRGQPVRIIVPAVTAVLEKNFACEGPFFLQADHLDLALCVHWAVIGD